MKRTNNCVRLCCLLFTRVHVVTVNVGAAVTAADTGEGGNGVSVAVTVTDERFGRTNAQNNCFDV